MAVRLFIENKEVELDESVQFAITKQFEDVTNPTTIINDWSKTVSIPFSVHNNELFGHIYNPDKITVGVPVNLLPSMELSEDFTTNEEIMHTDKTLPIHYGYPEILYPPTLYKSYYPAGHLATLVSYSVIRGTDSTTYETLLPATSNLGKHACTFTLTSGMTGAQRCITVKVQGTTDTETSFPPYVIFYLADHPDGKYNLTFDTAFFNTSTKQFNFKNMVLTRSESAIWADNMNFGVYFDPMYKLNFRLEFDNSVLMTGYAKMNEVKQVNGTGTYEITLFGQIGKVFQEMQKITFDKSSELTDYIIDGDKYVSNYITKDLVYSSWTSVGQVYSKLYEKTETNYKFTDIIGFAPNNALCEDFDYKTTQINATQSRTFEDMLEDKDAYNKNFYDYTGVEPSTVIPDGMSPRGIGEYRSYQQLPFIYWDKLFQMFAIKAKEVTGYDVELDNNWFNVNNPYWFRLVYMLKPLNLLKPINYANEYTESATTLFTTYYDSSKTYKYDFSGTSNNLAFRANTEQFPILSTNGNIFNIDSVMYLDGTLTFDFFLYVKTNLSETQTVKIRNNFVFVADFYANDGETEQKIGRICIKDENSTYESRDPNPLVQTVIINTHASDVPSGRYSLILAHTDVTFELPPIVAKNNLRFYFKFNGWHAESLAASPFVNTTPSSVQLGDIVIEYETTEFTMNVMPLVGKSNSHFTINDLWDNEYNLFSEILKYCKMYRIGIFLDDYRKKITFKALPNYFSDYTVEDWTNKIDKSKDFVIKPITFENKYVMFNYDDAETKLGEEYKNKYGVNYGDYRLRTQYNFNTDTTELFEGITPSIMYTENVLSWTNLYNNHKALYSFPSENFVNCKDEDNKFVSIFGSFFFHRGRRSFNTDPTLHLRSVCLSDDTILQETNNTYFYTQLSGEVKEVSYYPSLDVVYGNNMCLFNIPKENYTYKSNYEGKKTIYSNFWEKYINERYNIQNKVITCYVVLNPIDYNNFQFNKFVRVGNQICMVNKIYDYDVTSNKSTKVDLITVQDISGYTTNNY